MSSTSYHEPTALIVLSAISLGVAAVVAAWIMLDIIIRKGWRSMMLIMIPVYVINALYLWPITLWTYLKYGRPQIPESHKQKDRFEDTHQSELSHEERHSADGKYATEPSPRHHQDQQDADTHEGHEGHHGSDRPMFATVTIGVCHCGAGCVLGDVVGEWLVYGTHAAFGSPPRLLWAEYLVGKLFVY